MGPHTPNAGFQFRPRPLDNPFKTRTSVVINLTSVANRARRHHEDAALPWASLKPLINGPFTPDLSTPIRQFREKAE
jgi:hypothetical protein